MTGSIRLRARGPEGVATITLEAASTWRDLLTQISEKTGVKTDFDLKYGYPPKPLDTASIHSETKVADLPMGLNGEQLIVVPREVQPKLAAPVQNSQPNPATTKPLPNTKHTAPPNHQPGDFPSQPLNLTRKSKSDIESDAPEIPVPNLNGTMVLRIMPDDNSCLFRALSSALLGSELDGMTELRSIVASTIISQPSTYTTALLEKKPEDYCAWIQREDSWGGGIEIAILSQHFGVEVCSVNVQDLRVDRFNEGCGTRCLLVYSGIHYDVCALTPFAGAEPEFDRKVFDVIKSDGGEGGDEWDGGALSAARELCQVLQRRHYYTDTHGFSVKCNICAAQGNGEKWAVEHARSTGHGDFGEGET